MIFVTREYRDNVQRESEKKFLTFAYRRETKEFLRVNIRARENTASSTREETCRRYRSLSRDIVLLSRDSNTVQNKITSKIAMNTPLRVLD